MNRVKELRTRYHLSLRDLSSKVNINFSNLSRIERGEIKAFTSTMEKISDFFNVDMEYIIGKSPIGINVSYDIRNIGKGTIQLNTDELDYFIECGLEEEITEHGIVRFVDDSSKAVQILTEKINREQIMQRYDDEYFEKYRRLSPESKATLSQMIDFFYEKEYGKK